MQESSNIAACGICLTKEFADKRIERIHQSFLITIVHTLEYPVKHRTDQDFILRTYGVCIKSLQFIVSLIEVLTIRMLLQIKLNSLNSVRSISLRPVNRVYLVLCNLTERRIRMLCASGASV